MTSDAFTSRSCLLPPRPAPTPPYILISERAYRRYFPAFYLVSQVVRDVSPQAVARVPLRTMHVLNSVSMRVVLRTRLTVRFYYVFFCDHGLVFPVTRSLCLDIIVIIITEYHTGDKI